VTYGVHGILAACLVLYARDQCMTVSHSQRTEVALPSRFAPTFYPVPGVTHPNYPVKLPSVNLLVSVRTVLEMGEHQVRKRGENLFPRQGYTSPRCRRVDRTPAAQKIYPFTRHSLTELGKFRTVSWSSGYRQRARLQVPR